MEMEGIDLEAPLVATTMRDALNKWMKRTGTEDLALAEKVIIQYQFPPIAKMDRALLALKCCKILDLSTNTIETLSCLSGMKSLTVLILNRNYIQNLCGIEAVAETLQELYINNNLVELLKVIRFMQKLKIFHLEKNLVRSWDEFAFLSGLNSLVDLKFNGNPLTDLCSEDYYFSIIPQKIPNLKILDDYDLSIPRPPREVPEE